MTPPRRRHRPFNNSPEITYVKAKPIHEDSTKCIIIVKHSVTIIICNSQTVDYPYRVLSVVGRPFFGPI